METSFPRLHPSSAGMVFLANGKDAHFNIIAIMELFALEVSILVVLWQQNLHTLMQSNEQIDLLTSLLAFLRTYIYLRRGASDEQTFEYRQRHNTFKPPCMVYVRAMKPHISNTCLWYGFQNLIPNPQSHAYGIAITMATKSRINTKTNLVCF